MQEKRVGVEEDIENMREEKRRDGKMSWRRKKRRVGVKGKSKKR